MREIESDPERFIKPYCKCSLHVVTHLKWGLTPILGPVLLLNIHQLTLIFPQYIYYLITYFLNIPLILFDGYYHHPSGLRWPCFAFHVNEKLSYQSWIFTIFCWDVPSLFLALDSWASFVSWFYLIPHHCCSLISLWALRYSVCSHSINF